MALSHRKHASAHYLDEVSSGLARMVTMDYSKLRQRIQFSG